MRLASGRGWPPELLGPSRMRQTSITDFAPAPVPAHAPPPPPPPPTATRRRAVSLYDASVVGLIPWVSAGYEGVSYSSEHPPGVTWAHGVRCVNCDLDSAETRSSVLEANSGMVAFAYAAPPCRDLSRAGMRWWRRKWHANPNFQEEAIERIRVARSLLESFGAPYFIIGSGNSVLDARWRHRDATFQPWQFGGWITASTPHPLHPTIVPRCDAYTQKQALWVGGGFRLPPKRAVVPTFKLVKKRGIKRRISPMASWRARAARRGVPFGFSTAVQARLAAAVDPQVRQTPLR